MVLPNGATIAPLPPPLSDEAPAAQAGSAGRGSQSARSNHPGGNKIRSGHCGGAARAGAVGFRAAAGRVARSARPAAARRRVRVPGFRVPRSAAVRGAAAKLQAFLERFPVSSLEHLYIFFRRISAGLTISFHFTRVVPRDARRSRAPRRRVSTPLGQTVRAVAPLFDPGTVLPTFAVDLEVCGHTTWPEALLPAAIACGSSLGEQALLHTASGTVDTPQDELNLHACFLSRPCARDVLRR